MSNGEPDAEDREVRPKSWWQFGDDPSGPDDPWYGSKKGPEIATALIIFTVVLIVCAFAIGGTIKVFMLMF